MNYSFFYSSLFIFISIFFIILNFLGICTILNNCENVQVSQDSTISSNIIFNFSYSSDNFLWPTPGYTTITSCFGYRDAPTNGASTYHSGIDIAAPVGTNIISAFSGNVTYTGFNGAGRLHSIY